MLMKACSREASRPEGTPTGCSQCGLGTAEFIGLADHPERTLAALHHYYENPAVISRMVDFLGGDGVGNLRARFITADHWSRAEHRARPVTDVFFCMDQSREICRSLLDHESLLIHLDIEYVNFDFPGEPYLRPERTFELQAPVIKVAETILHRHGIKALRILSGRGHHFIWRVSYGSEAFRSLERIGAHAASTQPCAPEVPAFDGLPVPGPVTAAFAGLALVMESLAHEIKRQAAPLCQIPVELTAFEVGPSGCGREMIAIDISEYGDPVQSRTTRVPFSIYFKPWQQRDLIGREVVDRLPPVFFIPLGDMDVSQGLKIMRDANLAMKLAENASTKIPEQSAGTERLVATYLASPLHVFHDWFHSHRQHGPERWPETYDRLPPDALPPCVREVLEHPNDLLLRPHGLRLVTRAMLALGWHPRHIAGLIRSKFERDHGWGDQWTGYSPALRADFYARVFAGLFVTHLDDLVDCNCQSLKEAKGCRFKDCGENLASFRDSALTRRRYGYLAHRPFNRLFPSPKHL